MLALGKFFHDWINQHADLKKVENQTSLFFDIVQGVVINFDNKLAGNYV